MNIFSSILDQKTKILSDLTKANSFKIAITIAHDEKEKNKKILSGIKEI